MCRCEFFIIAHRVRQICPKLFRVLHFLSYLFNKLVKRRLSAVILSVIIISTTTLIASVGVSSTISTSVWLIIVTWKFNGLISNFLMVSVATIFLISRIRGTFWYVMIIFLVINEEIWVCVMEWNCATLTSEFKISTTADNALADVLTRFLEIKKYLTYF